MPNDFITIKDLEKHNWQKEFAKTPRYCVIGSPIKHSLSPQMHQAALDAASIDASYFRLECPPENLPVAIKLLKKNACLGANLTIPHKIEILKTIENADKKAQRIGAANTIRFDKETRKIYATNTDALGFSRAIEADFSIELRGLKIMLIGAGGGAGKAIAFQCAEEDCEQLVLVNRKQSKIKKLAQKLMPYFHSDHLLGPSERLLTFGFDEIPTEKFREAVSHVDLIVNASSLGMNPNDDEILPRRYFEAFHLVYDIIYQKNTSDFLQKAKLQGARTSNGLSMLLWQGALAFEFWHSVSPDISKMRAALQAASVN